MTAMAALTAPLSCPQRAQLHQAPAPAPAPVRHPSAVHVPAAGHPPRRFAYYPSDPEYHAPRRPQVVTRPADPADPDHRRTSPEATKQTGQATADGRHAHWRVLCLDSIDLITDLV